MAKAVLRKCPSCGEMKEFRADQKSCGCKSLKPSETDEITETSRVISIPRTNIHTLEELVEYCQIDLAIWEVERFIANKWEVGAKNDQDKLVIEPLFQIKAFLKKKVEIVDARREIEALKELAKKTARVPAKIARSGRTTGNMLEINIADHHFGKLAWGKETGGQNYDTKIAAKVWKRAFQTLLERSSALEYDEIWFVVGNDILNSDDTEGRTTKGTYVSSDIRYHKTFAVVRDSIIESIEQLRQIAKIKVKVIFVSGNHDTLSVWHLGDSIECFFHKYEDVEIDNSPRYYKFHEFGKAMILFTHGDKGKRKEYPLLMATEEPEMFGRTSFREAHTGHNHTDKVEEFHGVKVRRLPSLGPADAWHASNGFVGNLRSSEAFMWNKTEGLVGTSIYTDNTIPDIEAE